MKIYQPYITMSCQNFFAICIPSFDDGHMKCIFCNKVFSKVTHLEPHPTTHMIRYMFVNRSNTKFRYQKVHFLYDLDRLSLPIERNYQLVIYDIKERTNKDYYRRKKLTRQEMWILNERKNEAYNEYISVDKKASAELFKLDEKKDNDVERLEYYVSIYKDIYDDFKSKYEMQEHNRNGTMQQYIDDLYEYFD